jgi:hypothetical protein
MHSHQHFNDIRNRTRTKIQKFVWKHKGHRIDKASLSKMHNVGGIRIRDFKLHYKAIVTKNSMVLTQKRHKVQWKRIEDPEINLHSYSHLILIKMLKTYIGGQTTSLTGGTRKMG